MKYIYFGSDNFSLHILEGIYAIKPPVAIVTQPDRANGRKQKIKPGPLATFAIDKDIPLIQPENFKNEEAVESVLKYGAELFIVVSFGQILPQSLLDRSPPIINGHASLLPSLRGASPIQSSIMQGFDKTGMSVMHIVKALDAGPVIEKNEVKILKEDNGGTLTRKLEVVGIEQLSRLISSAQIPVGEEQKHEDATYCHKIMKEDMRLKYESETSEELSLQIRALSPSFGAYVILTTSKGELRVKIFETENVEFRGKENAFFQEEKKIFLNGMGKSKTLQITKLQPQGKNMMDAVSFLNGWNMQFKGELVTP
jgi:methionyl-tRNA formyltransferase